jgi:hypothetical protein
MNCLPERRERVAFEQRDHGITVNSVNPGFTALT